MADAAPSNRSALRLIRQVSTGGLVLGGAVGAATMATVGPYLAMGLAIWSGQTTEPVQPALRYPWLLTLLGAAAWGGGIWGEHRGGGGRLYATLSWGGGLLVALLPLVQLWRLWGASTP